MNQACQAASINAINPKQRWSDFSEIGFATLWPLITNLNIKWKADTGHPLFDVLTSQYIRCLSSSTSAQDKSVIQPALTESFRHKIQLLIKVFANQFGSSRLSERINHNVPLTNLFNPLY